MRRRLLNIATLLSLVLSAVSMVMWVRSGYGGITGSWELPPRPAPHFNTATMAGWVTHRHVESAGGRLVWINYDVMEMKLIPPVFYQLADSPIAPGQWGRNDFRPFRNDYLSGANRSRIPFVAEWYTFQQRGQRYIAVSWGFLCLAALCCPLSDGCGNAEWSERRPGHRSRWSSRLVLKAIRRRRRGRKG